MRRTLLSLPFVLAACGGTSPTPPDAGVPPVDVPAVAADTPVADVAAAQGDVTTAPETPNWAEHVAPILYGQCVSCHRAGGIAPFPLVTYAQTVEMAASIVAETRARRMPPTVVNATGSCNEYRDDVRRLTDAQIETLRRWNETGRTQGDLARAPQMPPDPPALARTDIRVDMGLSYMPNAMRQDDYRCFLVDPGNATDRFITGYEVRPGDQRVVHHMIMYALPTAETQRAAEALDARDTAPGYECFGGPGVDNSPPIALWAPGGGPTQFPRNTGLRLAAGRKVVMQLHYNMANGAFPDRTVVNLQTEASVGVQGILFPIVESSFRLPPRMSEAVATRSFPLTNLGGLQRIYVHGVAPHMHTLGRSLRVTTTDSEGTNRCVVDVPRWDFHWQGLYFYREPLVIGLGEMANITCRFDTTSRNEVVTWGEGTNDEMCLTYFYATAASGR
jgi:hypothetical protein